MTGSRIPDSDEGFGLVEVVVAMLLFAVIAMAILPLAVQATALSAGNRDSVAANAFASSELADLRAQFPDEAANSCAAVRAAATSTAADPAGTGLASHLAAASCPASYPAALTITVDVRAPAASDPTATLVTMATKIVVTAP